MPISKIHMRTKSKIFTNLDKLKRGQIIKKMRNLSSIMETKIDLSQYTYENCIKIIQVHHPYSADEIKVISHFLRRSDLCDHLKKDHQLDQLSFDKLITTLTTFLFMKEFEENQKIISIDEEADKFYILLDGTVGIYKPIYVQKDMKLKEYLGMMSDVKYVEIDELKYNRINEKNSNLNLDLDTLFKMSPDAYSMRVKYTFFVEEEQKLGEFGQGFAFGEIALIKRCTRNATIKALKPSSLVSIDKSDYNKVKNFYKVNLHDINLKLPYYLKSLEILIQHYTVPVAITRSLETAPEMFKPGLRDLIASIDAGDSTIEPYMAFARRYPVRDSMRMMRLLYRLSLGSQERKQEQLIVFSRTISNLQNKSRETKYKERLEKMEKKTMTMLTSTGAGVMIILVLAIFQMFVSA